MLRWFNNAASEHALIPGQRRCPTRKEPFQHENQPWHHEFSYLFQLHYYSRREADIPPKIHNNSLKAHQVNLILSKKAIWINATLMGRPRTDFAPPYLTCILHTSNNLYPDSSFLPFQFSYDDDITTTNLHENTHDSLRGRFDWSTNHALRHFSFQ